LFKRAEAGASDDSAALNVVEAESSSEEPAEDDHEPSKSQLKDLLKAAVSAHQEAASAETKAQIETPKLAQ
jgi:hypothetical protein